MAELYSLVLVVFARLIDFVFIFAYMVAIQILKT